MNTPKHATDEQIAALFELLPELGHDPFEQRRKGPPAPHTLTTVETEFPSSKKVVTNANR